MEDELWTWVVNNNFEQYLWKNCESFSPPPPKKLIFDTFCVLQATAHGMVGYCVMSVTWSGDSEEARVERTVVWPVGGQICWGEEGSRTWHKRSPPLFSPHPPIWIIHPFRLFQNTRHTWTGEFKVKVKNLFSFDKTYCDKKWLTCHKKRFPVTYYQKCYITTLRGVCVCSRPTC